LILAHVGRGQVPEGRVFPDGTGAMASPSEEAKVRPRWDVGTGGGAHAVSSTEQAGGARSRASLQPMALEVGTESFEGAIVALERRIRAAQRKPQPNQSIIAALRYNRALCLCVTLDVCSARRVAAVPQVMRWL
jgi:hypothetical protein